MDQVCNYFFPDRNTDDSSVISKAAPYNYDDEIVSPFIVYTSENYKYPSVYYELDDCIETCVLVYALAELRRMARAKELKNSDNILRLPLTHAKVSDFVEQNRDALANAKFGDEFYRGVLEAAEDRSMIKHAIGKDAGTEKGSPLKHRPTQMTKTKIIAFDDEYEKEELVYAIEVQHQLKRIMICFRGSCTKRDWATNMEIYMKEHPSPLKKRGPASIRVHNGFHDYLFQPSSRGAKGENGETLSEYQEIMQQHVLPVLQKFPEYKLYVTGHSLGGALATLFALQAAADPDKIITKPVSLFSIACPYVGDEDFRQVHQILEAQGKLRHLRVSNHKDLVTLVPKMAFSWQFYDPDYNAGTLFKHVGMNLRLYEGDSPLEFRYPKVRSGFIASTWDELSRGWDQSLFSNLTFNVADYWKSHHSLRTYSKRVRDNKALLQSVQLNDLYGRKDIVGVLVPHF